METKILAHPVNPSALGTPRCFQATPSLRSKNLHPDVSDSYPIQFFVLGTDLTIMAEKRKQKFIV